MATPKIPRKVTPRRQWVPLWLLLKQTDQILRHRWRRHGRNDAALNKTHRHAKNSVEQLPLKKGRGAAVLVRRAARRSCVEQSKALD